MTDLAAWCRSVVSHRPIPTASQADALRHLVVVVPSRNRQDYLVRQVAWWGDTPARLLLVDGTDEVVDGRRSDLLTGFPNVEYRHEPTDLSTRLASAGRDLDRPYAVLCGDDEFLLPAGLASAVEKLDREPELAGCIGQALRFYPTRRHRRLRFDMPYDYLRPRPDGSGAAERILATMDGYDAANCYAVLRSDVWAGSWGRLEDWTCPTAVEAQQALAVHARGPVGAVDDLYWLRSMENPPVDRIRRQFTLARWWRSDADAEERGEFVDHLAHDLEAVGVAGGAEARTLAGQAVDALIGATERRNEAAGWEGGVAPVRGRSTARLRDLLTRCVPDGLHVALGDLVDDLRRLVGRSTPGRYGGAARTARRVPNRIRAASPDLRRELVEIEGLVRGFHEARSTGPGRSWR